MGQTASLVNRCQRCGFQLRASVALLPLANFTQLFSVSPAVFADFSADLLLSDMADPAARFTPTKEEQVELNRAKLASTKTSYETDFLMSQ